MHFIFNANTPEELRQEIVQFLARRAEFYRGLDAITDSKQEQRLNHARAEAMREMQLSISAAKIEPSTDRQLRCRWCHQTIRTATPDEILSCFGADYVALVKNDPPAERETHWIHTRYDDGGGVGAWTCTGMNGKTADADPLQAIEVLKHAADHVFRTPYDPKWAPGPGEAVDALDAIRYQIEEEIGLRQKESA